MKNQPLNQEEIAELAELEASAAADKAAAAATRQRQHLDALRLRKRFAESTRTTPDEDFAVLETTAGNFVIRRPMDLEVEAFTADDGRKEQRVQTQEFLVSICLYPEANELKCALASFPALPGILTQAAIALCGKRLEAEGK